MKRRLVILRLVLKENNLWTAVTTDGDLVQLTDEEVERAKAKGGVLEDGAEELEEQQAATRKKRK